MSKATRSISRKSLPEEIADDLRERILSGEMSEGQPIRQEALAGEYGVSRMPVREALRRLDAEGLVQFETNRGGSVTAHSIDEIGEIFDLRMLIEVDLFRHSIPRMTKEDFDRCHEILEAMESSYHNEDAAQWGRLNHQYHAALYLAANRSFSNELLHRIHLQSDRYVRMHLSIMGDKQPAIDEHRGLIDFAIRREIEEGCKLLKMHIQKTKDELLRMVSDKRK